MVSVIRIKMKEKCSHKWYVTYNSSIRKTQFTIQRLYKYEMWKYKLLETGRPYLLKKPHNPNNAVKISTE